MCTGIEIALLAGTVLSGAATLMQPKAPDPPPLPASTPDPTRTPGAVVRVGGDALTQQDETAPAYSDFKEKRSSGKALGGLGRGGLGL